jgi:hypothetical protein
MSEHLTLTPDELLTTTRAVRRRSDFTRPVTRAVLEECLAIAQQARVTASVKDLAEHMHEAPVLVAPCIHPPDGRCEGQPVVPADLLVELDRPGGIELHARRPRPWAGEHVDHTAPVVRGRGRPSRPCGASWMINRRDMTDEPHVARR